MYQTREEELHIPILVIDGEIDHGNQDRVARDLESVLSRSDQAALLDFSTCTYIDGAVLGLLFMAVRRLAPSGRLAVVGATEHIRRMFHVAGLTSLPRFELFASRGEALWALAFDGRLGLLPARPLTSEGEPPDGRRRRVQSRDRADRVLLGPPVRRRTYGPAVFGAATLADRIHD